MTPYMRSQAVKLARYEDLTHEEIAKTLGCNPRTVAKVARKAGLKRNLRMEERLEEAADKPEIVRDLFRRAAKAGHTYATLSRAAGHSQNTMKHWLRDKSPQLEKFIQVADALGLDVVLVEREQSDG